MKKMVLIIISLLFSLDVWGEPKLLINECSKEIYLEQKIDDIILLFGKPNDITCDPFLSNHEWDTLNYKYDSFSFSVYRKTESLYRISLGDCNFRFLVDNNTISYNDSKEEIEKKIGSISFLQKNEKEYNVFLYSLEGGKEVHLFFDTNNYLKGLLYSYCDPD